MPFQRTVIVYEDIPLDDVKDSLTKEDFFVAEALKECIDFFKEKKPQQQKQSWDEYLVSLPSAYYFQIVHLIIDILKLKKQYYSIFYIKNKSMPLSLSDVSRSEERANRKIDLILLKLLNTEVLKPTTPLALHNWVLYNTYKYDYLDMGIKVQKEFVIQQDYTDYLNEMVKIHKEMRKNIARNAAKKRYEKDALRNTNKNIIQESYLNWAKDHGLYENKEKFYEAMKDKTYDQSTNKGVSRVTIDKYINEVKDTSNIPYKTKHAKHVS